MNDLTRFSPISRAVIVTAAIAIVLSFLQAAASIIALHFFAVNLIWKF